jgi:RNA polymerase sigma factor (sigma-70 family)
LWHLEDEVADGLSTSLRASARAPSAFSRVYEAKAQDVLVFLLRRTFDVEIARDLTAETFAQAFEHRARFRGGTDAEAEAWLYGIARHQLSRYARKGVVQRKAIERLGIEVPAVSEDDHQRIVELAGLADLRKSVADAFSTLPPDQREALRLRVVDEHAYRDVAATLGVSEETARARVSRALRRIADLIDVPTPTGVNP